MIPQWCLLISYLDLNEEGPVWVIGGAPGSRFRSWRKAFSTEQGVKSLYGGREEPGRNE